MWQVFSGTSDPWRWVAIRANPAHPVMPQTSTAALRTTHGRYIGRAGLRLYCPSGKELQRRCLRMSIWITYSTFGGRLAHGLLQPAHRKLTMGIDGVSRFPCAEFPCMPGSQSARSPADASANTSAGVAFRHAERRRHSGRDYFAAQYPASCQRFDGSLTTVHA